ncbi:MAG: heme ABC exporter ATP-binding protein CcmA [Nevskiales bacterium]|nr:heme ABC exporter ATP-binding protein CcmA [Nevskiales bacterium]
MPLLQVESLSVTRGDRTLIADLSLRVCAGELLHLRGANGAGKTSLLELLAGLRQPSRGRVAVEPEDLTVHWVGHRNGLNPHLSAAENLEFWCGLNGCPRSAARRALTAMRLPAGAQRRPTRTLSAGQKRRAALARLHADTRDLWLLDEPLDGLDRDGIALFSGMLAAHLGAGGMVVMTSHQALPEGLAGVREWELAR